jgi:hypothetical protein
MTDSTIMTPPAAPSAPAPSAPAPAGTPPVAGGTPAPAAAAWHGETFKGFVENKGWKTPDDALASYQNLEKLTGDPTNLLRVPKDGTDKDGWKAVYDKLGRPTDANGYSMPETLKADPLANGFRAKAHELGLSTAQFQQTLEWVNAEGAKMSEARTGEFAALQTKRMDALKAEHGAHYAEFMEDSRRAANVIIPESYKDPGTGETFARSDIVAAMESSLGVALTAQILNTAGGFQSEDKLVSGTTSGIRSPDAAQAEYDALSRDAAWVSRIVKGDREALAQRDKLLMQGAKASRFS